MAVGNLGNEMFPALLFYSLCCHNKLVTVGNFQAFEETLGMILLNPLNLQVRKLKCRE